MLIYWHVEKKSLAIHSQLINCTASEVAAMIEGAMRHGTTMDVEANYTDSHGQSEIGFGVTRLLNFDLLPRIKRINKEKLYRPVAGEPDAYPQLTPALTHPIRWELIAQQYDQMIKYATAIRAPRPPRRSCGASPATPPTPPTRRCWRSDVRRRPSSWPATCGFGTSSGRSRRA